MMTRLGHHATIGMPPVTSGHARSVPLVSSTADDEADDAAHAREPEQDQRMVAVAELERLERLGGDDGDVRFGHAGALQAGERALRRVRLVVEAVRRGHGWVLHSVAASSGVSCGSVSSGCSPTLSSQIEMIGTNFEKST